MTTDTGAAGAHRAASPEPVTQRGRRTRALLLDAARHVFEEKGYLETRIGDITEAADVAHGTFYTYFESKRELFREVVEILVNDFQEVARTVPRTGTSPRERIERANRGYLRAYRRNARMMGVWEQAAIMDPDVRQIRLQSRSHWVTRAEKVIRTWQAEGIADATIDAHYAANALGSMVDRFAFVWLVLGEEFEEEAAVTTLTRLYCSALRIDEPR
jgi:AcrR family transcriptional regulator